mgnify:CR=1 FL=1
MRSGDRGDLRAHGLEEGAVREGRAARRRRRRSSPATPRVCRSTRWRRRCPPTLRPRFCGIHFFNPPRYMHLVELIAQRRHRSGDCSTSSRPSSSRRWARAWSAPRTRRTSSPTAWACSRCWRRWHTRAAFGLGFDVVDALTGPAIGRAKSATYRTADVVGLDTMAHVIKTMDDTLPDDPWHAVLPGAGVAQGADRQGRAGTEDQGRRLPEGRQGHPGARPGGRWRTVRPRARSIRDVAEILSAEESRAKSSRKLRATQPSAGAIPMGDLPRSLSLLRRITSPPSPITRATSILRSAGASAGRWARSKSGRPLAGSR